MATVTIADCLDMPPIKRVVPVNIVIRAGGVWLNGRRFPSLKAARDYLDWLDNQRREAT